MRMRAANPGELAKCYQLWEGVVKNGCRESVQLENTANTTNVQYYQYLNAPPLPLDSGFRRNDANKRYFQHLQENAGTRIII
jgi:hypothetical protein